MYHFSFKRPHLASAYCDSLEGKGIANSRSGLFLAGPRRVGKSTFLTDELIPEASNRGCVPIYVDLWANKNANPATLIAEAIKTKIHAVEGKIKRLSKSVKNDKINILGSLTLDFSKPGLPENITLADALGLLKNITKKPILLIIDEAQHALTTADGLNSMFAIKSARDQLNANSETPSLMLVFTGSNRDKLSHLVLKKEQPFFGSEITSFPLLNQEFTDAFTDWANRNLATNNQFTKNSMWQAFKLVGYRPEILRQMSGQVALSGDVSHFADVLKQNAFIWQSRIWDEFENDFNNINLLQQAILETLINKGSTWLPFSEDSINEYKGITGLAEISATTVQAAIQVLRERNFIWQSGRGVYALEDESFAEWFKHKKHERDIIL